jgi:hypothetical protein
MFKRKNPILLGKKYLGGVKKQMKFTILRIEIKSLKEY